MIPNPTAPPRLLVIDDNRAIHNDFRKILCPTSSAPLEDLESALFGPQEEEIKPPVFEMDSAYQGEEGLAMLEQSLREGRPYWMAFVDVRMPPGWDGVETITRLWEVAPELQVVICTAYSDYSWSGMTARLKHRDRLVILKKPFDAVEVLQLAAALTEKWRLLQQSKLKVTQLEMLVADRTQVLCQTNETLKTEVFRRQRTAEALSESEERYHLLFHKNPLPLWVINLETLAFLHVNDAAVEKYGYTTDEFASMSIRDLHAPEEIPGLEDRLSGELARVPANAVVVKHLKKDGSVIFVEITSRVVTFSGRQVKLALANDITERKRLEAQFLRAQRIEGIGTLATGMAHDLNNILAPILMSAGYLRWDIPPEERDKAIGRIELSVKRGAEIIQQVLTFGRGIDGERVAVKPADLLAEIAGIVGQIFPKNISLAVESPPDLWPLMGDRTQIHQVLLNLCVNARDAMPKGGQLRLRAGMRTLTEPMPALPAPALPGPYIVFEVSDSGCGIAAGDRERIFDPFFTTKEVGKGTGLGLSTALGIVQSHRGVVLVESEIDRGTTFKVFLPASPGTAHPHGGPLSALPPRGAGEVILLVDDEPDIIGGMRQLLEQHNYQVRTAANGEEALDLIGRREHRIDALVTDIMMPAMDGVALIRSVRAVMPEMKIIASSGLGTDMGGSHRAQELKSLGVAAFLAKPYGTEKLLTTLHQLFGASTHTVRVLRMAG